MRTDVPAAGESNSEASDSGSHPDTRNAKANTVHLARAKERGMDLGTGHLRENMANVVDYMIETLTTALTTAKDGPGVTRDTHDVEAAALTWERVVGG